ncbi:hypothetical protein GCM10027347_61430 [Larkinella harenae]
MKSGIVKMPIGDLIPNEENPRTIQDGTLKKLTESLKSFPEMMNLRPIIVNEEMVILGGNMRYKAAQAAGWNEVPVMVAKGLTPEQEREFIIKDNVSSGEWDEELLADWDSDLLSEWGLDLESVMDTPKTRSTKDGSEIGGKLATKHKCPSCGHEFD